MHILWWHGMAGVRIQVMTPFEMGKAYARCALNLDQMHGSREGSPCEDGHLFLTFCDCAECMEYPGSEVLMTAVCILCFEYIEEEEDDDLSG